MGRLKGAKGDVIRTLPILLALKEKFPDPKIYWVTKENSIEIIKNSPHIHKVLNFKEKIEENFDLLYNLDIEEEATLLASKIKADKALVIYSFLIEVKITNTGKKYQYF